MIAHTIASWDFGAAPPLAISTETRKEAGEAYSAVLGFFRQFEIYCVVADEHDVVGVRTNHRGETVRLYRTTAKPELAKAILPDDLAEINALHDDPAWYNAATHNCTTTTRHHVRHVAHLLVPACVRGNIRSDVDGARPGRRRDARGEGRMKKVFLGAG